MLQRIAGQHWRLIALFAVLGVFCAQLMHAGDPKTYTGTARFVLDTQDPKTQAESASIADTARGIATSPEQVERALAAAGARRRDATTVAEERVTIRALGASGVLQLSVRDGDPRAAAAIANALAGRVISARLRATNGGLRQVLADIAARMDRVTGRIAELDRRIDALSGRASPDAAAQGRELLRLRDFLSQQRGVLESERTRALATDDQRPSPSIINPARAAADADASGRVADTVLGAVLGLILGTGVAALLEALRPTLVGGDVLAKELDAPLIGTLEDHPDESRRLQEVASIAARLRLAARAVGAGEVALLGARHDLDLRAVATELDAFVQSPAAELALAGGGGDTAPEPAGEPGLRVRPFDVRETSVAPGGATGLVAVFPTVVKKPELDGVRHLLRVSPGPLLGVITYRRNA